MLSALNNLKLQNRILAGYSVPIALSILLTGFVWSNAASVSRSIDEMKVVQEKTIKLANTRAAFLKAANALRAYLINNDEKWLSTFDDSIKIIDQELEVLSKRKLDAEQRAFLTKIQEIQKEYLPFGRQVLDLAKQGKQAQAIAMFNGGKGVTLLAEFQEVAGDFFTNLTTSLDEDSENARGNINALIAVTLIGSLLVAIASVVIAILISKGIAQILVDATTRIATSSTEIATTVEQQERTITQQASSVNETTTTMEELGVSSLQSAEQAEASASGARQVLTLVEDGTRASQQAMEGMGNLKEKVSEIAEQIIRLGEQTGQIAGISDLVSDIANQTNMLALNAAVEAVRAGEQGKGFGVVAAEIRKLADQTKKSAEKINTLVAEVQASMNSTVMVTDEGTKTAIEGLRLAEGTANTFNSVADAINSVFVNSQQITLSAKQQAVAVQQVVAAMNSINIGAQETSTAITQVKSSTGMLSDAVQNLKALV
jgi:methyl-accepting chemotaxis protein